MKKTHSIALASVAGLLLATLPVSCGKSTSDDGSGGDQGSGSGGKTGSGGSTSGTGGSTQGTGGSTQGTGGSTQGTGGSTQGTGGKTSGTGGSTQGVGGSTQGTGGKTSGTGGSTQGVGGSTQGVGGSTATGTGGSTATGVGGSTATGTGGSTATGTGGSTGGIVLPCEILGRSPNKCVTAHSTVRVIVPGYTGPLYQLCKGTANPGPSSCKGTTQDIGSKDGYADVDAHKAFCPSTGCTISKIYDQASSKLDMEPAPAGGAGRTPDPPANANDLPVIVNGHSAYGILIKPSMGYRAGCTTCNIKTTGQMAKGDEPQTMYWITSQKDLVDQCCFDYGNCETTSNDDGNGTMETMYFGGGVVWGTGFGGKPGPWMMLDLENGLYAGWENKQDKNISTNKPLKFDFVHGVGIGDTKEKNNNKGRFAIYGGDATGVDATYGKLAVMYDGIRPEKPGYVPMLKQGSIELGIGGDNSKGGGGRFYEGACATGPVISKAVADELHAAIVALKYKNP